ncbi:EI24 domain-containing protein [Spongiivirga citrea]|uniref:Coproporphyrinogen III oxidase n=1 Tax=Spongiivirga citrea TaxID=1481457 RepID=A0A6M0CZ68_9FLAO|nr:EI24 domain-containing protein [Spongiivirga citrea]NER19080.1 coproporphyrinogen III oxidase [Spongiivirga citrea]
MFKDIKSSISAYGKALALIKKLKLYKYFIAPVIISIITGGLILTLSYLLSETIGDWIARVWVFDFGAETVSTISHIIGGLLVFALGLILFKHIVMALSAPFMSPVSEKIEKHMTGEVYVDNSAKGISKSLARAIRVNVRNLFMEFLFVIPLVLLSFIPVIGLVFSFLVFLVQAYYAGFGCMDYTLERHYNYKESVQFVRKNRGLAYGNGAVFMLMLLIPIVGVFIVLPLSTVASTTETVKRLAAHGKLKLIEQ